MDPKYVKNLRYVIKWMGNGMPAEERAKLPKKKVVAAPFVAQPKKDEKKAAPAKAAAKPAKK